MHNSKYLLSICIPTYNRASIIRDCVDSCLEINSKNIEIVVTDNASTDGTYNELKDIKDSRFKYFRNNQSIGYENIVRCILNSSGKYALVISDEDKICDLDLELLKKELSIEQASLFRADYYEIDGTLEMVHPHDYLKANYSSDIYRYILNHVGRICGMVFKVDDLRRIYDEIDKSTMIWKLYPHVVASMYMALHGDFSKITSFKVKAFHQIDVDLNSCKVDTDNLYFFPEGRYKITRDWIRLFAEFPLSDEIKGEILFAIVKRYRSLVLSLKDVFADDHFIKSFGPTMENKMLEYRNYTWYQWQLLSSKYEYQLWEYVDEMYGRNE